MKTEQEKCDHYWKVCEYIRKEPDEHGLVAWMVIDYCIKCGVIKNEI